MLLRGEKPDLVRGTSSVNCSYQIGQDLGWKSESRVSLWQNFGDLAVKAGQELSCPSWGSERRALAVQFEIYQWSCAAVGYFRLATNLRMTLQSIVRDLRESFGNISRRKASSSQGFSGDHRGKSLESSDELQDSLVLIQQSSWASLPPELLGNVLKRLKQDDSNWPSCQDVVACASVCTTWRYMCKDIARKPEFCGKLTLPVSLKQPGPRDGLIQCFIKRDKSKQTYHLYLSLSTSVHDDNGKFLLSAKRSRRMTYNDFAISMDSKNISRSGSGYIGGLRSTFFRRKFTIYDTMQPPYSARILCSQERNNWRFCSRKVSPKVPTGSYPIAQVEYQYNALGTRGPRQMQCTMHSIPASAADPDGVVPVQPKELLPGEKEETPLVLGNKAPRWHTQLQCWCLNFRGRVTMASVKNFQLTAAQTTPAATGAAAASEPPSQPCPGSSSSSSDHDSVILQFGRVSEDTFTMDYRYPLSAFQAFAICLTSFDTQVALDKKDPR